MRKREIQNHLKHRWGKIHKIELEELKKTTLRDRFIQTSIMFNLGKYLKSPAKKIGISDYTIIRNWQRLKNYYNGPE